MQQKRRVFYAYAYNELNDVYTIRGVEPDEMTLEPRMIKHVPLGLISQIKDEYSAMTGFKVEEIKPTISSSEDEFFRIIDFHGRKYSFDQVKAIIGGHFVDMPYANDLTKENKDVQKIINKFKPDRTCKN